MCSICLHLPCLWGCTNAPEKVTEEEEKEPVIQCDYCGAELFEGDEYLDAENAMVCKECVEEMSVSELLEVCGLTYDKAS